MQRQSSDMIVLTPIALTNVLYTYILLADCYTTGLAKLTKTIRYHCRQWPHKSSASTT